MGFAIPPGMTLEQMLKVMGTAEPAPEPVAEPVKPARKRARDAFGRVKADDPATPENEAWEPES